MSFTIIDCSDRTYEELQIIIGFEDSNLSALKDEFKTSILVRDSQIKILEKDEQDMDMVVKTIQSCFDLIDTQRKLTVQDVHYIAHLAKKSSLEHFKVSQLVPIAKTRTGKMIYPKTLGQALLCDAMKHSQVVFSTGVAGTGKTYLAVAYAVSMLKQEKVEKIILTRPAVEAGESLGFLPGDMKEKVDPYLRPLYDALHEMLGVELVEKYMEKEVIEVAPLAFMRGRTLNNAIVILDEAQNTTHAQMKMFLTRMGKNTKMIITGDVTQIDLIKKSDSGLMQACEILKGIEGIEMVHLQNSDVVRNPLVQKIIERYALVD